MNQPNPTHQFVLFLPFYSFQGEFVDGGTDTTFIEDGNRFVLSARTSGNKRQGIVHALAVNGVPVQDGSGGGSSVASTEECDEAGDGEWISGVA